MKQILLIITGFILLTLIFTYPAVFHLTDRIIGDGGDNYQFLAFQYLANQQVLNGQFSFGWTNYWRYPVGFDFSTSYDSTLLLLIGIFLYQFISSPIVVYNLSVLFFLFLNSFFSYLFFQKAARDKLLGFIGGLIYGFSFYTLAQMGGYSNLILAGCFPFFFYALHQLYDRQGNGYSFVLLTISVFLIFLISLQYALILAGVLIFLIPISLLCYKEKIVSLLRIFWLKGGYMIFSIIVIFLIFLFFNSTRVIAYFNHTFMLPSEIITVPVINYFLPNSYLKIIPSLLANGLNEWIEYAVFLGFLEIILFLFFLFTNSINRKLKVFLLVNMTIFFVLALGGDFNNPRLSTPYSILFRFWPFQGIAHPARFYVFLYLLMTLCILSYLRKFLEETGKLGFLLILGFLIFERIPTNFYLSQTHANREFIKIVQTSKSKAILDLPIFTWWNGSKYDLYSIYYQKPIVNGYIHWSGHTRESNSFLTKLKSFECRMDKNSLGKLGENEITEEIKKNTRLLQDLEVYGIYTVVFHKDLSIDAKECQEAIERIKILLEKSGIRFKMTFEDQDTSVYQLES